MSSDDDVADDICGDAQDDGETWIDYLRKDIRACPSYPAHGALLEDCCTIAGRWRDRFCDNVLLWSRIRRRSRLAKELGEVVPVIARCIEEVAALEDVDPSRKVVILDLCSGFGYLAMFLSELLPPSKVDKVVLVDIKWAPHTVEPQPHHLDPAHVLADGWPIRLTTSRCNLKSASDRRTLLRAFAAHGAPVLMLGVHLCGTLSLRAVEMFNEAPAAVHLALKPCCLPNIVHAQNGVDFSIGGHSFAARTVAAHGRWSRGRWTGSAGRDEVERKFHCWVDNLHRGVAPGGAHGGGSKTLETHRVQATWFQNAFVFASRAFSLEPPASVVAYYEERRADELAAAASLRPGESVAEGTARRRNERHEQVGRRNTEDAQARAARRKAERAAREAEQRERRLAEKRARRQTRRDEIAQGLRPPPPDVLQLTFDLATPRSMLSIALC